MSATLNLASQPFRNRALPWTIAAIITIASLLSLIFLITESSRMNTRAAEVERERDSQFQQISALERQAEAVKQALTPEQKETLQAAQSLVGRKRFSWARLFADLESVLPGSVRVKRITVRDVAVRGERTVADLELAVVSKNPADATGMILEMDRGGIFQAQLAEQNLEKEKEQTVTVSTMRVIYSPRASVPASANNNHAIAAASVAARSMNGERR
jgi:Tfp pilus assembly protein PilN